MNSATQNFQSFRNRHAHPRRHQTGILNKHRVSLESSMMAFNRALEFRDLSLCFPHVDVKHKRTLQQSR